MTINGIQLAGIGVSLIPDAAESSGTVTLVSVVGANGFAGSVANATTTPAITIATSVTGLLKGDGTGVSAATTTGTGSVVQATSPTLVTPVLGVAAGTSLALGGASIGSNALAVSGHLLLEGVTSTGATGTGNLVFGTSPTFVAPALGTPASGVATNLSGTAAGLTAGGVTTNANLTGPITSSGNATSIASQTGTGSKFVVDTSPTLVTPALGVATATSLTVSGATIGSAGNITVASGQALKLGNSATTGLTAGVLAALTNATIVITDASGQAYRIPCII